MDTATLYTQRSAIVIMLVLHLARQCQIQCSIKTENKTCLFLDQIADANINAFLLLLKVKCGTFLTSGLTNDGQTETIMIGIAA